MLVCNQCGWLVTCFICNLIAMRTVFIKNCIKFFTCLLKFKCSWPYFNLFAILGISYKILTVQILSYLRYQINYCTHFLYTLQNELLILLSDKCLLLSSNKSLIAVTASTNTTGSIAISLPKALIAGTQFNNTIHIKYTFAILWNCSNKFFGKKDSKVYFVVLIWLSLLCPFGCSFGGVLSGTKWLGMTIKFLLSISGCCRLMSQKKARRQGPTSELRRMV